MPDQPRIPLPLTDQQLDEAEGWRAADAWFAALTAEWASDPASTVQRYASQ